MKIELINLRHSMRLGSKMVAGIFVTGLCAPALSADTPEARALSYNAAYDAGAASGASPQTLSEMLTCSAIWDRWDYAVTSAADPKFTGSLRQELKSSNAKRRKLAWQRQARREMDEDDDTAYFDRTRGRAEEYADKIYAAYANNEEGGMNSFMNWLGTCK